MTALAADRSTDIQSRGRSISLPVKASTTIYAGSMVCVDLATGYAVPAANTAGLSSVVGRAEEYVANTGASGAKSVRVNKGVHAWKNASAGQAIVAASLGKPLFVVDDQTVGLYATNGIPAGICEGIDADTSDVWVSTYDQFVENEGIETVTVNAGAAVIDPKVRTTKLDITGTCTATLADGTVNGQRKTIIVIAGASTPALTLTCATPSGHTTVSAIGAKGDSLELVWLTGTGWVITNSQGVTIN